MNAKIVAIVAICIAVVAGGVSGVVISMKRAEAERAAAERAASEETVRPWRIRCAAELRRRNPSAARPAVFASTVSACIDKAAAATIDEITNAVLQKRIATLPMSNGCILPFLHSRRNYELRSSRYQREKSIICNPCFLPNMKAPELRADGRSSREWA